MMFWPVGTVPSLFRPQGSGRTYTPSPILQPFEDAGLRQETIVLYGTTDQGIPSVGAGGSEGGVVFRSTGAPIPGTRVNGGEGDDAIAGGPSIDQSLLKHASGLSRTDSPLKYVNAIGDARVDSQETSCQCLSYAYQTREVKSVQGANVTEHVPLMPELSPSKLYTQVFAGFMPGGATPSNQQELLRALQLRKSVLDYALGELSRLKRLAPASESAKIEFHAEAIRKIEQQLSERIDGGPLDGCTLPDPPDPKLVAQTGSKFDYANPTSAVDESAQLAELGKLHLGVIRAAFQCDVMRVGTFMWTSAVDHVAFAGQYPDEPSTVYRHHPMSHKVINVDPVPSGTSGDIVRYLANVQTWFNARTAEFLTTLKNTQDVFGNSLLDNTIVPFVTDIATAEHLRSPLPSLIFGGRSLGRQGGQYLNFEGALRKHNDVWLSIAQAYLPNADIMSAFAGEAFAQYASGPIPGLWSKPV